MQIEQVEAALKESWKKTAWQQMRNFLLILTVTTSAEVYAIQEDMIESIAYGQSTPEEAADNAIELLNDYLSALD